MDFENVGDFLENELFAEWLRNADPELDLYWKNWLENHPQKKEQFYQAVAAWKLLSSAPRSWPVPDTDKALAGPDWELEKMPNRESRRLSWYYAAAAIVVLAVLGGVFYSRSSFPAEKIAIAGTSNHDWKSITNSSLGTKLVNLPDGTSVLLSAGSRLSFPEETTVGMREVRLEGEAFFEVVKNAESPFFVHTSRLTTKVLGTSFRIRSFADESDAKVAVVSGRVEVQPAGTPPAGADTGKLQSVILEKNQAVTLEKNTAILTRSGPEDEKPALQHYSDTYSFDLKFVPASEIFAALEKHYGVRIEYDSRKFGTCTLTANLEDLPFLKKLDLICSGIDATYSLDGTLVRISGPGCHQ